MIIELKIRPQFEADSKNYEVLTDAAMNTVGVPGLTCEIGLRRGAGSKFIIDGLLQSGQMDKTHIAIDMYGSYDYKHDDYTDIITSLYTNTMRDECLSNMHLYASETKINFIFFNLEDSEFFARYADGVPVYTTKKNIINQYSLIHLDGAHTLDKIYEELNFFVPRMSIGGWIVFDDVGNYPHEKVDALMLKAGFENTTKTERKWAYQKKREMVDALIFIGAREAL